MWDVGDWPLKPCGSGRFGPKTMWEWEKSPKKMWDVGDGQKLGMWEKQNKNWGDLFKYTENVFSHEKKG